MDERVSMGHLSLSAYAATSEHVVGGIVLLPGVGFIEIASAAS